MSRPLPSTSCQQSRQCVISGPTVGNFWSTRLAPEQGMEGGCVCAPASGASRQQQNARITTRRALRESFILVARLSIGVPLLHVNALGREIYNHNWLAQVVAAAAERQPHAAVLGAGVAGIGGADRQPANGILRWPLHVGPNPEARRGRTQAPLPVGIAPRQF